MPLKQAKKRLARHASSVYNLKTKNISAIHWQRCSENAKKRKVPLIQQERARVCAQPKTARPLIWL